MDGDPAVNQGCGRPTVVVTGSASRSKIDRPLRPKMVQWGSLNDLLGHQKEARRPSSWLKNSLLALLVQGSKVKALSNGPKPLKQVERVEYWSYPTWMVQANRGPIKAHPSRFGLAKRNRETNRRSITRAKYIGSLISSEAVNPNEDTIRVWDPSCCLPWKFEIEITPREEPNPLKRPASRPGSPQQEAGGPREASRRLNR